MKFASVEAQLEHEKQLLTQIFVGDVYCHHKNKKEYTILGFARDSETLHLKVIYQAMYVTVFGENSIWVRDLDMFLETVTFEGALVPRFSKVSSYEDRV